MMSLNDNEKDFQKKLQEETEIPVIVHERVNQAYRLIENNTAVQKKAPKDDMYPEFWTHIYKLGGHHGCFSVFYRRHPFCFCLDSFAIIVINIFINSNCKFFK